MVQDLADYLRFGISRPPSKIGLKIHPEEVLAHKLNVSIRNVRKAIANLESDGVLIRQRGRGTFVRKVPQVTGKQCVDSDGKPVFPFTLPIEQLFPEVEKKGRYVCRNFIDSKMPNSSLSISMWIDVSRLSATWRLVLSGVINSAEGLGHKISIHSTSNSLGEKNSADIVSLEEFINKNPSDGYIVPAYFEPLVGKVLKEMHATYVFYQLEMPVVVEPTVILGWEEAIERGIQKLIHRGSKKILTVWNDDILESPYSTHMQNIPERVFYENGLPFSGLSVVTGGVGKIFSSMQKILDSVNKPDGILVTDDFLLEGVCSAVLSKELQFGRDIGLVTISHKNGTVLPKEMEWSRLEFNTEAFGRSIHESLVARLQNADFEISSQVHLAHWIEGKTSTKTR